MRLALVDEPSPAHLVSPAPTGWRRGSRAATSPKAAFARFRVERRLPSYASLVRLAYSGVPGS